MRYEVYEQSPLGTPLPGLHHGLDKVKSPILTIGPQHGCLFWYLATVQQSLWFAPKTQATFLQDHNFASSSFSSITIRCSRLVFFIQDSIRRRRTSACSPLASWTFDVGRSSFSVNLLSFSPCPLLPQTHLNNPQQHHKIDAVGRHLKVKVKKAVKGHGNQTA